MIYDCIVIGAGASGLFFTATFDTVSGTSNQTSGGSPRSGFPKTSAPAFKGLVLEGTAKVGTKLLMSGSGQCNITHAGSIKDFVKCYGDNGKKIRSILYKYSNAELIEFLEDNGIPTLTREDGKVFPKSLRAQDILDMLIRKSRSNGFDIKTNFRVTNIEPAEHEPLWQLTVTSTGNSSHSATSNPNTTSTTFIAKNVVFATGGLSYPGTGSDGSALGILKSALGINVTPLNPALAPVNVADYPYEELSGIAFPGAHISVLRGDKANAKKICENTDGLLLTHTDFSGPAVLNISKYIKPSDWLSLNYVYPEQYETVFAKLKSATASSGASIANTLMTEFKIPKRFASSLVERHGTSPKALAKALTSETFQVNHVLGFGKAMVTTGGISLSEIDLKTMELKKHPGVYIIGEMCDIDGMTGGYNLQFAYSSARAAGAAISTTI